MEKKKEHDMEARVLQVLCFCLALGCEGPTTFVLFRLWAAAGLPTPCKNDC